MKILSVGYKKIYYKKNNNQEDVVLGYEYPHLVQKILHIHLPKRLMKLSNNL